MRRSWRIASRWAAGLQPPRFLWVPFDDILLFPLNNSSLKAQSPDRKIFFGREELLLKRYLKQLESTGAAAIAAQNMSQA